MDGTQEQKKIKTDQNEKLIRAIRETNDPNFRVKIRKTEPIKMVDPIRMVRNKLMIREGDPWAEQPINEAKAHSDISDARVREMK